MNWFALSCVTALTQAVKDTFLKRSMAALDATTAMIGYCLSASVFLWLAAAAGPPVALVAPFWTCLAVGGVLGGVTYWLYGLALKAGDLSLTLPMLAFTPLFLLVTSPLTLGEFPEPGGLCGIALVVAGAYVLNLRERKSGVLGPIKALWTRRGPRLMLAVAAIWSIGANLDKLGLRASSPLFWGAAVYTATFLALLGPRLVKKARAGRRLPGLPRGRAARGHRHRLPDARPAAHASVLRHCGQAVEHRFRRAARRAGPARAGPRASPARGAFDGRGRFLYRGFRIKAPTDLVFRSPP